MINRFLLLPARLAAGSRAAMRRVAYLGVPAIERARRAGAAIGVGSRVYTGDFGSEPWLVEIGDGSTVSIGVRFVTHDGALWLARDHDGRRYSYGRIRIGNRCFVGAGAIILPGVDVQDDSIVAAGSVVTRSVPPGSIVAGVPARIIGNSHERIAAWLNAAPSESARGSLSLREFSVRCADESGFRPWLEPTEDGK